MMFWIVAALMTFAACAALLSPFLRPRREVAATAAHDLAVYKDQLRELDRDRGRGLIADGEAEQARAELGRRILALSERGVGALPVHAGGRHVAAAAVLMTPLVAWGIYALIGAPNLPAQPLQARLEQPPEQSTLTELVARAERHLADNPDDARGWTVVAPIYMRVGRTTDAVNAYRNAIRLSPPSADLQAAFGEAIMAAADGAVTPEAVEALEQAVTIDPNHAPARYLLAAVAARQGREAEARALLEKIRDSDQVAANWREAAQRALAGLSGDRGPSADQIEAAEALSPDQRMAMIDGMVESLAARLKQEPGDTDGWIRLVRSFQVLGREEDARRALEEGLSALAADDSQQRRLQQAALEIGVSVQE